MHQSLNNRRKRVVPSIVNINPGTDIEKRYTNVIYEFS